MTQQIITLATLHPGWAVAFGLSLHIHLAVISRRLTRVESTPTVKRELTAQHSR